MTAITYRTADVNGLKVFYREAGASTAPKLLLLHGFPTAGHMFHDLIPLLADRFHLIAPDLPGFGQTAMPERSVFKYTFEGRVNQDQSREKTPLLKPILYGFKDVVKALYRTVLYLLGLTRKR